MIITLFCVALSFLTTVLVVSACMLSARISHNQDQPENYDKLLQAKSKNLPETSV
jgi:hypothetical protein